MSFTGAILQALTHPLTLSGRAGRHEFWCFFAFYIWVWLVTLALLAAEPFMAPVLFPIGLSAVLPMFSVTVRRLHDIGLNAYWMLLAFVPVVGSYALSLALTWPGTKGDNRYGPVPVPAKAPGWRERWPRTGKDWSIATAGVREPPETAVRARGRWSRSPISNTAEPGTRWTSPKG